MTSKYEEISTNLVGIVLDMMDITEKFNKMGTKEIDSMIASALNGSKRINSTLKKVLDLDTQIGTLRQSITKANLQSMISTSKDVEDDPKVDDKQEPKNDEVSKDESKNDEPKVNQ